MSTSVRLAKTNTGHGLWGLILRPLRKSRWHWSASHWATSLRSRGVGEGVSECRIDFGPGYRIYFGKDGEQLIILLGGGTKKRQNEGIESAKEAWREYKQRKKNVQKIAESGVAA
jgi:hypothetical protein